MRRGFTLIELLAVIVILAIIALIAVPIVINIIDDSKNSSDEQSVELYLDTVQKIVTKKQLSNSNFNPDKCIIKNNGDLDCYEGNNKIETLQVEVKGQTPEKGIIELKENKYIYKNILLNGKYYYERGVLVSDLDNNNEISIGDKYTYKVNDTDKFYFYVLSFNEDNTINLIMDRNICNDGTVDYTNNPDNNYCRYAWSSSHLNKIGPDIAMINLYKGTKMWTNVPNMNLEYNDTEDNLNSGYSVNSESGYTGVIITDGVGYITNKDGTIQTSIIGEDKLPIKARLPKYSEVTSTEAKCHFCNSTLDFGTCSSWLVNGLQRKESYYPNNEHIIGIIGYWLLNSHPYYFGDVFHIDSSGCVSYNSANSTYYGIRPVITVSKSDLE